MQKDEQKLGFWGGFFMIALFGFAVWGVFSALLGIAGYFFGEDAVPENVSAPVGDLKPISFEVAPYLKVNGYAATSSTTIIVDTLRDKFKECFGQGGTIQLQSTDRYSTVFSELRSMKDVDGLQCDIFKDQSYKL